MDDGTKSAAAMDGAPISQAAGAHAQPLDLLSLRDIDVRCIVGVYPSERDRPQPLVLDVDLWLDTRTAARSEQLDDTVDYGRLAGELRFLLESCRFRLLETAAEALARWLLAPATPDRPHPRVERARVRLTKPEALGGGARASLEVMREARDASYDVEHKPFGQVDIIHVSRDCGIYRLRVGPRRAIPTHVHRVMDEHELVLGAGLLLQGRPVAPGLAFHWPRELPHRYDNPTDVEQSLLCVDRPPFIPADEIEVADPAGGFVLPPPLNMMPPGAPTPPRP